VRITTAANSQPEDEPEEDAVVTPMKKAGIPVTRERYLRLAFLGNLPEDFSPEEEMMLPPRLRRSDC